jgi:1,2-diacylglycerol 3-alpha-glucosyltransferase
MNMEMTGTVETTKQGSVPYSVAIVCSGLGRVYRGYEASTLQLYQHIKEEGDFRLYAGGDDVDHGGQTLFNFARDSPWWRFVPKWLVSYDARYSYECRSAAISLFWALRKNPVDIVFTSDHLIAQTVAAYSKWLPVPPKLIFSNGGPFSLEYCQRYDFVHQKSFADYRMSQAAAPTQTRNYLIANGFDGALLAAPEGVDRAALRRARSLPVDKTLVLSLAALHMTHKRGDWLAKEIARLPADDYHLLLAGAPTGETQALEALCQETLPQGNFTVLTEPPETVPELLWAADVVALASLSEGFGRAIAEAMAAQCPLLVHPHENAHWVVDNEDSFVDMTTEGALADRLSLWADDPALPRAVAQANFERFQREFDWSVVLDKYLDMFAAVAAGNDAPAKLG